MKPEDKLVLQLFDAMQSPLALPEVVVDIDLFTGGRHRYGFRLRPTDRNGELRIGYEDIEAKRLENAKESLMDYNTPLDDCDARVRVTIPTADDLRRGHEIATRWAGRGETPDYAKSWLTANNAKVRCKEVFVELKSGETVVQVPCELIDI